jgi:hypothetical protein
MSVVPRYSCGSKRPSVIGENSNMLVSNGSRTRDRWSHRLSPGNLRQRSDGRSARAEVGLLLGLTGWALTRGTE